MKKIQQIIAAISDTKHNSAIFKSKFRQKLPDRKSLLLAASLSFLFSSSSGCAETSYVPNNQGTTPKTMNVAANNSFFPFGFYHVSWNSTAEQRMNDLRTIAAAGFNTIHASLKGSDDLNEYKKFLDEAQRLGVRVITEFGIDRVTAVNQLKDKPAVLAWNIRDDAGISGSPSCDEILKLHNAVKAADPNHSTYISVAPGNQYKNFNYCSDIIGAQDYPIPSERTQVPLHEPIFVMGTATREAAKFNRKVYANLQSFAWKGYRSPSFKEVRNMTYQSLIKGVKGIIYYTYHDDTWDMSTHTALWKGMKTLPPEIKQLSPMLLNENLTEISTGIGDIYAGVWTYQNQAAIVVVNSSYDSTQNLSLTLPLKNVTNASPMFANRPSGMVVKDGKLTGSIKPLEVHVYSLKF